MKLLGMSGAIDIPDGKYGQLVELLFVFMKSNMPIAIVDWKDRYANANRCAMSIHQTVKQQGLLEEIEVFTRKERVYLVNNALLD